MARANWINLAILIATVAFLVGLLTLTDVSALGVLLVAALFVLAVIGLLQHGEIVLRRGRYRRR